MSNLICHNVDKTIGNHIGIDQYIAEKTGWSPNDRERGLNPSLIASFRGMYDTNASDYNLPPLISPDITDPTIEQLEEAYHKLMEFRKTVIMRSAIKVANPKKNVAKALESLRYKFTPAQRKARIKMISTLFSLEVDRLQGDDKKVSRNAIVNGFRTVNGEYVGGPVAIFNALHKKLMAQRQQAYTNMLHPEEAWAILQEQIKKGTNKFKLDFVGAPANAEEFREYSRKRYEGYTRMLEHWNMFLPFVMRDLVKTEGLNLNIKKEYMTVATSDSYSENDIAAKWDMSEAVRDGWQRNNDLESAFGSIGQQVRRALATVYEVESYPEFEEDYTTKKRIFKGVKTRRIVDELGFPVFKDPLQVHQQLRSYLRGVRDSKDLMDKMIDPKTKAARIPWMQPIVDILTSNPTLATQFFVDFKKNFQLYSMMYEDKKNSKGIVKSIKTKIINRSINAIVNQYNRFISGKVKKFPDSVKLWGFTPVMNTDGSVNWERLAELRETVLAWVYEEPVQNAGVFSNNKLYKPVPLTSNKRDTTVTIKGETMKVTPELKRSFLMEVFSSLGFDVTMDTIEGILNSRDIYEVRSQLEQLFDANSKTGILYAISKRKEFKSLTNPSLSNEDKKNAIKALDSDARTFKVFYNTSIQGNTPVKEHIEKLLKTIATFQDGSKYESKARYQENTMYSDVNPCFMGDRLEDIASFVDKDDKEGLFKYLNEHYLSSPFFVDNEYLMSNGASGVIFNSWLEDMVKACKNPDVHLIDSVAAIFNYERDLGNESKRFEDFTSLEHAQDMLLHYFADEQVGKGYEGKGSKNPNRKLSALYPVFILGDAGVSKYIRAPRVTTPIAYDNEGNVTTEEKKIHALTHRFDESAKERLLDKYWNLYIQERRRIALDKGMAVFYANGSPVNKTGEFSFLTFLNESSDEYIDAYKIPENRVGDEKFVKGIIRKYLENASLNNVTGKNGAKILSFKQRLDDMGVLETVEAGNKKHYKFLDSVIKSEEELDEKIADFYWNTKLATAEQLQLMTIDPSFYKSTKDLQKRYKEIHAPGTKLDIHAVNPYTGELYSSDGIERMAYFKDIAVNSEEIHPEFMEVILRSFAKDTVTKEELDKAIREGVLIPKSTDDEETARRNRLADLMGEATYKKVYAPYTENTLTDGQGYRTLSSYRKVMGMAGKWTEEMENAYNEIMAIRAKHTEDDELSYDELRRIADFALTLQPIKPYMFTHEKYKLNLEETDENGQKVIVPTESTIPVQHKYAEALIIPELLPKGSKLRHLAKWMEDKNIDMVGSDKIAKVGAYGQADLSKVTSAEELSNVMNTAVVHELPYEDYRIQTNVPEHINASQLFGTQVRKLIMAGLNKSRNYGSYIGGAKVNLSTDKEMPLQSLTGDNLLALFNSLICANIWDSNDRFESNASDIESLSEMLQQATIGSSREMIDNIFSYVVTGDDKFLVPLFEGGLEHDSAALLLSTFKKIVNKQQISGGSAVQVSAFGITGYEESDNLRFVTDQDAEGNNDNILYAEIELPFDRSYEVEITNEDGSKTKKVVSLNYEKYCYPSGDLIPTWKPLEKGTEEWKKYQSYTYKTVDGKLVPCSYKDTEAQVYKPLMEEDYPDILSILAYRIPTENDYSMLNCRIKRFTSKFAGGTIRVPAEGTTIAGFDFDIDKLYFMQREYHKKFNEASYVESKFSEHDKMLIWESIYADYKNDGLKNDLIDARDRAEREVNRTETVEKNGKTIVKYYKDDKLMYQEVTKKDGTMQVHHFIALDNYYEEEEIEEYYTHKSKSQVFAEKARELGIAPTKIEKGEKTEELDTYDFSKTPEENSRASRNNLLITLIQGRLMDKETIGQRYTPGGFENAKNAARLMRELKYGSLDGIIDENGIDWNTLYDRQSNSKDPEPNYSPTDPYTILAYNQQNQVASKLIGIFANQNTHNAFVSCLDEFRLKEPINLFGKAFSDLVHKDDVVEASRVNLNLAEFLAASVDAVKDPVLNFLNLNTITADSAALLAKLGFTMEEVGIFFNQPSIVDICQDAFNRGVNVTTAIKDAKAKLIKHIPSGMQNVQSNLSKDVLTLSIINNRKAGSSKEEHSKFLEQNAKLQYDVLDKFEEILKAAKDVSDFITNTKFTASNAVSSTFGGMYAQQLRVDRYVERFNQNEQDSKNPENKNGISYTIQVVKNNPGLSDKPIDNNSALLSMSKKEYLQYVRRNPFAYEQLMYDCNRKTLKLLAKYFPYETAVYKDAREIINGLSRYGSLSEDEINDIHRNLPVALLAAQTGSEFDGESYHKDTDDSITDETNRTYYRETFAGVLNDMLNNDSTLSNLSIFKFFYPKFETISIGKVEDENGIVRDIPYDIWTIDTQDVGGLDINAKEAIAEDWAFLMRKDEEGFYINEEYARLGQELFMYCFYQMGFNFNPVSFMHLAPTDVKNSIMIEKPQSTELNTFDGNNFVKSPTNVKVWSDNDEDNTRNDLATNYAVDRSAEGVLQDNTYKIPDVLDMNSVRDLIAAARNNPDLNFMICRNLTNEEMHLFSEDKEDIPVNIYFTKETKENTPINIINSISYGRKITYTQFLNRMLQGKQGLNVDNFAQQWLLNNLDNPKFVLDLSISGNTIRELLSKKISPQVNSNPSSFTIDLSVEMDNDNFDRGILSGFIKAKKRGDYTEYLWCPVIKFGGSYYMASANANTSSFNAGLDDCRMTYYKVEPFGAKKTIEYDRNKSIVSTTKYVGYFDVHNTPEEPKRNPREDKSKEPKTPEVSPASDMREENPFDGIDITAPWSSGLRRYVEDILIEEYIKATENHLDSPMMAEDKMRLTEDIRNSSERDIKDTVEDMKKACRKDGIFLMNADGEFMQGC